MTLIYILYINTVPLYDGALARRVEMFNETILLIISYHMMVFANRMQWTFDEKWRFSNSVSLIATIGLLLLVNVIVMGRQNCLDLKHKFRLRKLSNKHKHIMKERAEAFNSLDDYFHASLTVKPLQMRREISSLKDEINERTSDKLQLMVMVDNLKEVDNYDLILKTDFNTLDKIQQVDTV